MQKRGRALAGFDRIEHGIARLIIDRHKFGGVFGNVAAFGDDDGDGLADIAHPLDRERPLLHRRLHRGEERIG